MTTYIGFSTQQNYKKYTLTDFELAKQDLINNFNIRKGEKLMNPAFGCIVWDMLFEPLDESTQEIITEDITRIAKYDPRVTVGQIAITEKDNGLLIELTLAYVPTDQRSTLSLIFDKNSKTLTTN
jgi:phage baseplate assembly protein W